MPRLAKGGKWVFGWVVVSPQGAIRVPPEAYAEYGFRTGEELVFLSGSRTSRGFSIGRKARIRGSEVPLERRAIGRATMGEEGRIVLPPGTGALSGDRLLVGRGSGVALGFIQQGSVVMAALEHPELPVFTAG